MNDRLTQQLTDLIDHLDRLRAATKHEQPDYHQVMQIVFAARLTLDAVGQQVVAQLASGGLMLCGHPVTAVVESSEGTAYCSECERAARNV